MPDNHENQQTSCLLMHGLLKQLGWCQCFIWKVTGKWFTSDTPHALALFGPSVPATRRHKLLPELTTDPLPLGGAGAPLIPLAFTSYSYMYVQHPPILHSGLHSLLQPDSRNIYFMLEPPQQRGPAARGFVEMPRIPPKQRQGSNRE